MFGEILEPSSRALWSDDYAEELSRNEIDLQWNEPLELPKFGNNLYVAETSNILSILQKCLINLKRPIAKLTVAEVEVYNLENGNYLILKGKSSISSAKIIPFLYQWLQAFKNIYVLTSTPITTYQSPNRTEKLSSFIKSMSTTNICYKSYPKLESPNLVTGLGASVFTYCTHFGINCELFISYMDTAPLDLINTSILSDLLTYLEIGPLRAFRANKVDISNNLYM